VDQAYAMHNRKTKIIQNFVAQKYLIR